MTLVICDNIWHLVVRATLLLVPLLGLHYLVIPFRPPKNHPWENFYEVLSAITASFQVGASTFFAYCFIIKSQTSELYIIKCVCKSYCNICFEQTSNQIVKLRKSESFMHLICILLQPFLYISTDSSMPN